MEETCVHDAARVCASARHSPSRKEPEYIGPIAKLPPFPWWPHKCHQELRHNAKRHGPGTSPSTLYFCLEFILLFGSDKCGKFMEKPVHFLSLKAGLISHASVSLSTALRFLNKVLSAKEPVFLPVKSHLFAWVKWKCHFSVFSHVLQDMSRTKYKTPFSVANETGTS